MEATQFFTVQVSITLSVHYNTEKRLPSVCGRSTVFTDYEWPRVVSSPQALQQLSPTSFSKCRWMLATDLPCVSGIKATMYKICNRRGVIVLISVD